MMASFLSSSCPPKVRSFASDGSQSHPLMTVALLRLRNGVFLHLPGFKMGGGDSSGHEGSPAVIQP